MKKILILGLALCMGVSLSSCEEDNEVRPMSITPTGTFDEIPDDSDDTEFPDDDGTTIVTDDDGKISGNDDTGTTNVTDDESADTGGDFVSDGASSLDY